MTTLTNTEIASSAAEQSDSMAFRAARRWRDLDNGASRAVIFDRRARESAETYRWNIENYIGTVQVPVGIAGPLRINGESGTRDYTVPLATSEAALVASYNRGANVLSRAGGCNVRVVAEGVSRTPMFAFRDIVEACCFTAWIHQTAGAMQDLVPAVTRHGRLQQVTCVQEGNHVYVDFRFTTGDAAGQNMVTFVTDAICQRILEETPVKPRYWFLEANLSGDKKASAQTLAGVRGRRVVADAILPRQLVVDALHTTPERMVEYWYAGAIGGVMSGTTGVQGHFANGLAALYLACGQDIACVAESATGVTRMEPTDDGDLYVSVTLPNIIVGTVGGGSGLPSARACLDLLGLAGKGNARAFAEVCAGTVLAGEISIIGAFCSGDFARAHHSLSRGTNFQRGENNE
jgi:hydroxymethylglutaryl-CoA reductase (NADPH)